MCIRDRQLSRVQEVEERAGYGVRARVDGRTVLAGNRRWMEQAGISCEDGPAGGTTDVYKRQLPEGARVTRIAPSPTGYLHLGVFFTALVNRLTADASKGVFYFRLEDTDKKREVEGGAEDILRGFNEYGLAIDEGFVAPGEVRGGYGPRCV